MKKIFFTILLVSILLLPSFSYANLLSTGDEEIVATLLKQVQLLIAEVEKLKKKLTEYKIPEEAYSSLEAHEMRDIISSGVLWFKEAQEESGHFSYEYLPYEDIYLAKDNIVRQAGGLYILGEVAVHDAENIYDLKETLVNGIKYFEELSHEGNWNGYSFYCIGNSSINHSCKLGATSLALVGLIDSINRYPELKDEYDGLVHNYGRYILAMKKDGSGFRHNYSSGSVPNNGESSFSNGEALLALVRFYQYRQDEEVKNTIDETFLYFNTEEVGFDFPLYLWVMAAVKDMQELWPKEEYVTYVDEYTEWRVNGFMHRKGSSHNMCAYVEGVISAYSVLEGNVSKERLEFIQKEINYWLNQSKDLQIGKENKLRIIKGSSGSYFGEILNMKRANGGFLTDQNELTQRIDFTQHCINSYTQQLIDINKEKF